MTRLRVAPIVEGHGEVHCIRILLQRIWTDLLGGEYIEVLQPIRKPRSKLVKPEELERAVKLALLKLGGAPSGPCPHMVLVLIDADKDAPCILGPSLLDIAKKVNARADVACVLANIEYETWFVAAAESLHEFLELPPDTGTPENPEAQRAGKGWIGRHFVGEKYSETVDQPRMTAKMDLQCCRARSPSFDKLCRELEKRRSPNDVPARF